MFYRPLKNRVIIRCDKERVTHSEGGILLPDTVEQLKLTGTVVAVGPECKYLQPKARVMYPPTAGFLIESDLAIMTEDMVICTIHGKEENH